MSMKKKGRAEKAGARSSRERSKPISLHGLTPEEALKQAMEAGPMPRSDKFSGKADDIVFTRLGGKKVRGDGKR